MNIDAPSALITVYAEFADPEDKGFAWEQLVWTLLDHDPKRLIEAWSNDETWPDGRPKNPLVMRLDLRELDTSFLVTLARSLRVARVTHDFVELYPHGRA